MDTSIVLTLGDRVVGQRDDASRPPSRRDPDAAPGDPVVVAVRGELSPDTEAQLVDGLCGLLQTHGAVVADVSALHATSASSLLAFIEAASRAGEWPDVRLVIAAPDPACASLLATTGVGERAPIHPDVETAAAHLDERPALVHAWWHFDPDPHAPGDARGHVRRVCRRWQIDDEAREAAEIVVTELVTNAVEHAESAAVVEVERRPSSFRLTVRDYDLSVVPQAHLPDPTSPRGRGLAMVAAVARDWGVEPHDDGKTIWAEMAA